METTTRKMKSTPMTNSTEVLTIIGLARLTRRSLTKTLIVGPTKTRNNIHGSPMQGLPSPRAMTTVIKIWKIDEQKQIYFRLAAGGHDAEWE